MWGLGRLIFSLEGVIVIGLIIIAIWFYFTHDKDSGVKYEFMPGDVPALSPYKRQPKGKKLYKHEERCREIFQEIYGKEFKSVRPNFLKNPVTGKNLELDGFCPSVRTLIGNGLAFEYDGAQHSQYVAKFHRGGPDEFLYQAKKDSWKDRKCEMEGILLIRIPHYVPFDDLDRFIKNRLRQEGILPPKFGVSAGTFDISKPGDNLYAPGGRPSNSISIKGK